MRRALRSVWVAALALLSAVMLAVSWTVTTATQLAAVTALIMGGTGHPLSTPPDSGDFVDDYLRDIVDNYIQPAADAGTGIPEPPVGGQYNAVAVITPEEFWPVNGVKTFGISVAEGRANLDRCVDGGTCDYNMNTGAAPPADTDTFVAAGYSQSAVVASLAKADLIARYQDSPEGSPEATFSFLSNPMRGNGGILMRFNKLTIPLINIPMYGATPTNTCQDDDGLCYPSIDVAQQYDLLGGDAPNNLFNILALVNSLASYGLLHGEMPDQDLGDAEYQDSLGDTDYYLNPAELLPILMPLEWIGIPRALLLVADAPMRVLIENAYRRDINPGEPTLQYLLSVSRPLAMVANVLRAIPVGIDDGLQEAGLPRLLGTEPAGKYGVGGDDEDLRGLPVGFIPLGSADPTPNPPSEAATAGVDQHSADGDEPAEPAELDVAPPPAQDGTAGRTAMETGMDLADDSVTSSGADDPAEDPAEDLAEDLDLDPSTDLGEDLAAESADESDPVRQLPNRLRVNDPAPGELDRAEQVEAPSSIPRVDERREDEVPRSLPGRRSEPAEKQEPSGQPRADQAA